MRGIVLIRIVALLGLLAGAWPVAARAQNPAEATPNQPAKEDADHSAHQDPASPDPQTRRAAITDDERAAAFPDVRGHTVHDNAVNFLIVFDRLEWQTGDGDRVAWDGKGWVGGDLNRLWFRAEGAGTNGGLTSADAHLLYGRAISRWWEMVAGIRQDMRPGSPQAWGAIGLQGLAPYWFDVEVTGYVGAQWRTEVRLEAELDVLVTNRLILQPHVEMGVHGKSDPERGVGSGLGNLDAGLRLRYELRRELAPYVGVVWSNSFFGTADLAEADGNPTGSVRLAVGVRAWF